MYVLIGMSASVPLLGTKQTHELRCRPHQRRGGSELYVGSRALHFFVAGLRQNSSDQKMAGANQTHLARAKRAARTEYKLLLRAGGWRQ